MKDKNKRLILITAGILVSAVLVALIAKQMTPPPTPDVDIPSPSSVSEEVNPQDIEDTEDEINPQPIESQPTNSEPTADDEGEEQSIQPTPEKPEYSEEELTDSSETPDGGEVTEPDIPKEELENPNTPPTALPQPSTPTPEQPSSSGGLPGFSPDQIIQGGENEIVEGESDGDINKQVGDM